MSAMRPTLLIVNDNLARLRSASSRLALADFRVMPCQSAEDALLVLGAGFAVDAIVTDRLGPGSEGIRFIELRRSASCERFDIIPLWELPAVFAEADADPSARNGDAPIPTPLKPAA